MRLASESVLRHAYEQRLRQLRYKRWLNAHKLNDKGARLMDRAIYSTVLALRELNRG